MNFLSGHDGSDNLLGLGATINFLAATAMTYCAEARAWMFSPAMAGLKIYF